MTTKMTKTAQNKAASVHKITKVDKVGDTFETGRSEADSDENEPELPADQKEAWRRVDEFIAHGVKINGHRPRKGVVTERFNRFLADVRREMAAKVAS